MSINWANKYVSIDASTANGALRKTLLNVVSSIGDPSIAGTWLEIKINNIEKTEANIPVITTWSAFFWPYISDIKSVIKNVKG